MRQIWFRFARVLLVMMAFFCVVGCPKPADPPEPNLIGSYHGTYAYQNVAGGDTVIDEQALITFRFTSSGFSMFKDSSIPESLRVFCDVAGTYELVDGVVLHLTDSSSTPASCQKGLGPDGFFALDQTADSVKLTQIKTEEGVEVTTRIRLLKDE